MSLQFVHSHDSLQPHSAATWGVAVTSTNDVLSTSLDGTLALRSSSSSSTYTPGARIRTFPAHPLAWVSLSVAPTASTDLHTDGGVGKRALINSIAGTTVMVDYTTGEELGRKIIGEKESGPGTKSGWAEPAWSVALCSDGRTYASTGASGAVTLHSATPSSNASFTSTDGDAFGTRLSHIPTGRLKFGLDLAYSPVDSTRIAMSNEAGQVFMVDTVKEAITNSWASHAMPARSLGWSGDGNLLISASDDRRLVLYDSRAPSASSSSSPITSSAAVAHLSGHTHSVLAVALSPGDGRLALSGGRDGTVRVWDVGMRKAVGVVREGGAVWSVAWRPMEGGGGGGAAVKVEEDVKMEEDVVSVGGGAGSIGGSGAMGFVTGGEEGLVRWYRGAGMV